MQARTPALLVCKRIALNCTVFSPIFKEQNCTKLHSFLTLRQFLKKTSVLPTKYYFSMASYILDWKVVGLYSENNDNLAPKKVQITESRVYDNININVDFNNIPKQPF